MFTSLSFFSLSPNGNWSWLGYYYPNKASIQELRRKRTSVNELNEAVNSKGVLVSPILPKDIKNYLIDIDGTIGDDVPNEEPWRMKDAEFYPDALEMINKWYDKDHVIYFFTSRTEEHREVTEEWLKKHGFQYHGIIFGKPRGGNYHWIDNHIVRATRFNSKFTDLVVKSRDVEVFDD
jgi:hypothetical protein